MTMYTMLLLPKQYGCAVLIVMSFLAALAAGAN